MKKSPPKKQKQENLKKIKIIWGTVLFIFSVFLYSDTYRHGFVYDDLTQIEQNTDVQKGIKGIPTILTSSYRHGYDGQNTGLYRPLSNVTFALEYERAGLKPSLYHIDNIWIYALVCLLFFLAFSVIFERYGIWFSILASALFAFHPLHTEVVCNIKSRDELLNAAGLFSTLLFLGLYIKNNKSYYLYLSVLCYIPALFSKESSVTFLAIFPLIMYFNSNFEPLKILKITLIYCIPAALFLLCMFSILQSLETQHYIDIIQNTLMACKDWGERSATVIYLLGKYLLIQLIPYPLISDYSYNYLPVQSWSDWKPYASLLVYISLIYFSIRFYKKYPVFIFSLAFYGITMALVSNVFITISWTFGERFLFIPITGFCLSLVYAMMVINKKDKIVYESDKNKIYIISGILIIYTLIIKDRNKEWESNKSLFAADVVKAPQNARLKALRAKTLFDEAETMQNFQMAQESETFYREAIAIYPYRDFINGLGTALNLTGKFEEAVSCFKKVIRQADTIPDYYHNLGLAHQGLKQFDEAAEAYRKAIALNPGYVKSVINLSGIYGELKLYREAINWGKRALELSPQEKRLNVNMCVYYRDMGMKDSALYYFNLGK